MKNKIISISEFNQFKSQVLGAQLVKKEVLLSEIEIVSTTSIALNGVQVKMSDKASAGLRKILGLPVQFSNDMSKTFGEESRKKIVDMCKLMKVSTGKTPSVTLVIDPTSRQIANISAVDNMLSMEAFFNTFESLMNQHNFDITNIGRDAFGGVNIAVVSEKSEFQVGNFADEIFHPGMSFTNSMDGGSYIQPYMLRLVCTNGMVNPSFGSSNANQKLSGAINLGSTSFQSMDLFYKHIEHFVKGGFYPEAFKNKIQIAMKTMASYAEIQTASGLLTSAEKVKVEHIENYVPIMTTNAKYKALGVDPTKFTNEQAKSTRTDVSIWDLINGVTDFASHDYGFEVREDEALRMQVGAGQMLDKKLYDAQNIMNIHLG